MSERTSEFRYAKWTGWEPIGQSGDEMSGNCTECHGEGKMYLNVKKGVYHCKKCDASGRYFDLIDQMVSENFDLLSGVQKRRFAAERGLSVEALTDHEIYSRRGWIVFPHRDISGKLSDLKRRRPGGKLLSAPGGEVCPYGAHQLADKSMNSLPVDLCEGPFDAIALSYLRKQVGEPGIVLGMPGAGIFKRDWAKWLSGRDVTVYYDNDEAGAKGETKIESILRHSAKSMNFHCWPHGAADGMDVNDLVREVL